MTLANSKNRQIQCTRERRGLILYLAADSGMRPKEYLAVADAAVRDQGVNATRAVERNGDKHPPYFGLRAPPPRRGYIARADYTQTVLSEPAHLIAVFDPNARRHVDDLSTSPYLAPHGVRWGPGDSFTPSARIAASFSR
jgi:hypothetical protein